ncbi:PLD nuclease N-terminal domain-containing protein [Rariglobus hedericola]|uniref:Uncharacterized protein n=1 Tax=Rariglobus hedericola TaxID=2597822 RepID=A0A556QMB0_9BACT|nr:PLD nuclease N-terminal domain-containing protein [Rariglobus hedericola]TSJ77790.1 hypothetical protein FPL22_00340 [Rariglobus hedericola]
MDPSQQFTKQLDAITQSMQREMEQAEQFMIAYAIAVIVYFIFATATGVHCASKGPTKNNASWMMLVILIPVLGPLAYWIFKPSEDDLFPTAPQSGVFPPAPPPRTSRSIADEITADLAKRKRP